MQNKDINRMSVIFATLKMALATFSSRILGLVREQVVAATFGASGVTDAFTVAYRVPNMLRDLFAEGAFSSAFVPIFTEVQVRNFLEAKRLFWSAVITLSAITGVMSLLIAVFADQVVLIVTNDEFVADLQRYEITVSLVRILSPFLVMISLAALFMGALNTLKVFFIPSLAPALFNICMILCVWLLPPYLKEEGMHPIFALAFGVIFGGLAQMLIQVPLLIKKKINFEFDESEKFFHWSGIKTILNRLGIGTIGVAATQINVLVSTILATGTVIGAVSWMNYAFRLFQFPVGVLSVSIAGSNLVHFSEYWKGDKKEDAIEILSSSYLFALFSIIPIFCLLYVFSTEITTMIFQRGHFTQRDTLMVSKILQAYLIGLPFYGFYKIFSPLFFTLDKPQIPVSISVFCISLNIALCVSLVDSMGFIILPLGTSFSIILNCLLQAVFLKKLLNLPISFYFNLRMMKFIISGIIVLSFTAWLKVTFAERLIGFWNLILYLSIFAVSAVVLYLVCLYLFGEKQQVKAWLKRK